MKLNSVLLLSPPFGGTSVTLYPDLVAACVAELRATPAVVSALGDAAGTPKIFTDENTGRADVPYIVIHEEEDTATRESTDGSDIIETVQGTLRFHIFGNGKLETRQYRDLVMNALDDAELMIEDASLLYFRRTTKTAPNLVDTAPGTPKRYVAVVVFSFILDRVF